MCMTEYTAQGYSCFSIKCRTHHRNFQADCCVRAQLDRDEQLELWGLLANMLAVEELVPGQLLGHVERAVLAGQQRLMRHHRP